MEATMEAFLQFKRTIAQFPCEHCGLILCHPNFLKSHKEQQHNDKAETEDATRRRVQYDKYWEDKRRQTRENTERAFPGAYERAKAAFDRYMKETRTTQPPISAFLGDGADRNVNDRSSNIILCIDDQTEADDEESPRIIVAKSVVDLTTKDARPNAANTSASVASTETELQSRTAKEKTMTNCDEPSRHSIENTDVQSHSTIENMSLAAKPNARSAVSEDVEESVQPVSDDEIASVGNARPSSTNFSRGRKVRLVLERCDALVKRWPSKPDIRSKYSKRRYQRNLRASVREVADAMKIRDLLDARRKSQLRLRTRKRQAREAKKSSVGKPTRPRAEESLITKIKRFNLQSRRTEIRLKMLFHRLKMQQRGRLKERTSMSTGSTSSLSLPRHVLDVLIAAAGRKSRLHPILLERRRHLKRKFGPEIDLIQNENQRLANKIRDWKWKIMVLRKQLSSSPKKAVVYAKSENRRQIDRAPWIMPFGAPVKRTKSKYLVELKFAEPEEEWLGGDRRDRNKIYIRARSRRLSAQKKVVRTNNPIKFDDDLFSKDDDSDAEETQSRDRGSSRSGWETILETEETSAGAEMAGVTVKREPSPIRSHASGESRGSRKTTDRQLLETSANLEENQDQTATSMDTFDATSQAQNNKDTAVSKYRSKSPAEINSNVTTSTNGLMQKENMQEKDENVENVISQKIAEHTINVGVPTSSPSHKDNFGTSHKQKSSGSHKDKTDSKQKAKSNPKHNDKAYSKDKKEDNQKHKADDNLKDKADGKQKDKSEGKQKDKSDKNKRDKSDPKYKSDGNQKDKSDSKQMGNSYSKLKDNSEAKQNEKSKTIHKDKTKVMHKEKTDAKQKSETKHGNKSETKHGNKSEAKHEDKANAKHEEKSETKQKDKSQAAHKDKSDNKQKDKSETKQKDKSETKQKNKSETKQKDKSETKRTDKTNVTHMDKADTKQEEKSKTKQDKNDPKQRDNSNGKQKKQKEKSDSEHLHKPMTGEKSAQNLSAPIHSNQTATFAATLTSQSSSQLSSPNVTLRPPVITSTASIAAENVEISSYNESLGKTVIVKYKSPHESSSIEGLPNKQALSEKSQVDKKNEDYQFKSQNHSQKDESTLNANGKKQISETKESSVSKKTNKNKETSNLTEKSDASAEEEEPMVNLPVIDEPTALTEVDRSDTLPPIDEPFDDSMLNDPEMDDPLLDDPPLDEPIWEDDIFAEQLRGLLERQKKDEENREKDKKTKKEKKSKKEKKKVKKSSGECLKSENDSSDQSFKRPDAARVNSRDEQDREENVEILKAQRPIVVKELKRKKPADEEVRAEEASNKRLCKDDEEMTVGYGIDEERQNVNVIIRRPSLSSTQPAQSASTSTMSTASKPQLSSTPTLATPSNAIASLEQSALPETPAKAKKKSKKKSVEAKRKPFLPASCLDRSQMVTKCFLCEDEGENGEDEGGKDFPDDNLDAVRRHIYEHLRAEQAADNDQCPACPDDIENFENFSEMDLRDRALHYLEVHQNAPIARCGLCAEKLLYDSDIDQHICLYG